jgi:hypothetical protein
LEKSLLTKAFIIKGHLSEPTEACEDENFRGLKVTIRRIVMFGRQRVGCLRWPLANQGFDDSLLTDHFVIRELPSEPTEAWEDENLQGWKVKIRRMVIFGRKRSGWLQWPLANQGFDHSLLTNHFVIRELPSQPMNTWEDKPLHGLKKTS